METTTTTTSSSSSSSSRKRRRSQPLLLSSISIAAVLVLLLLLRPGTSLLTPTAARLLTSIRRPLFTLHSAAVVPSDAAAWTKNGGGGGGGGGGGAKQPQKQQDQIRKLFRHAKTLERHGQWRKAARILNEILVLNPTDAHSHLALARLEARRSSITNNSTSACAMFRHGTKACPGSVHLWQAWAVYEEKNGHVTKAAELFEHALSLDSYNPYVCHAYGLMQRKLGHPDAARELWERALSRGSTAALVCSLGELLIAEKEYEKARELYDTHVLRLKSGKEKTEVYLAMAWLEERFFENCDRAKELIEMSIELSPRSSVAQVALARLEGRRQQRRQGSSRGIKDVRAATVRRLASVCINSEREGSKDAQPVDGRVYNAWANLEVKAKRFNVARNILYRGLTQYPEDHSLLQAAGAVEERLGNYTGARELYGASLSIQPSAPTLVAYALLDMRHYSSTDFNNTKRLFEEALLIDQRHGPAYNAYARAVFERQGDETAARRIYERGLRVNCTDSASIYHGYAKLELSLGNVNRARELLLKGNREVCRVNVGTDSPHRERAVFLTHTLGMLELNSNRPSNSLDVFMDGIARYGNSSQLLLGAALCEMKLGNDRKAREFFERSVTTDEKHAQAWQAWAVMEMRAGNLETAKTLFECGIKSAPKHGAMWQAYGVMESRLGNVEKARALFEKGIRLAPKQVSLYRSWASLEMRKENYRAAKALISQALTRDKRHGSGWLIAAEIEQRLGNRGLANLLLRRGIECSPTNARLYCALGNALVRQGKINEAREIMEKGIEVDPMHAPLYHSLAELEARVFNLDGLAKLNKRAAAIFNTNALVPAPSSSEVWGSKIRAGRNSGVPKGVAALAERIVEEEGSELGACDSDPSAFLDQMMSSNLLEEGLVGQLLNIDEDADDG